MSATATAPERQERHRRALSKAFAARVLAVQGLYQAEVLGLQDIGLLDQDYRAPRLGVRLADIGAKAVDPALLDDLMQGAWTQREDLDHMISGLLTASWRVERLDSVLRALLRVGLYELAEHRDRPAQLIIQQFVQIAGAFWSDKVPGLVNATLDTAAQTLRDMEAEAPKPS